MTTTADLPRLGIRDGHPVVEVRDGVLWYESDRTAENGMTVRDMLAELEAHSVPTEPIYDRAQRAFWEDYAPDAAGEAGYNADSRGSLIYSEGRMSGWIYPATDRWGWMDYTITDYLGYDRETGNYGEPWCIPPADSSADEYTRDEYAEQIAQRERFMTFARLIRDDAIAYAESDYIEGLADAVEELRKRQARSIIRGEN